MCLHLTSTNDHGCPHCPASSGTTRNQLAAKGDQGQYTDFANIVVAFAFILIPIIGWLLDKKVHHPCLALLCASVCFLLVLQICAWLPRRFQSEHGLLQGYGITLGAINGLNLISSILQSVPNLQIQVVTLITWMIARFFMYSR